MIFSQDRNELRRMYKDAWRKHVEGLPMTPLEAQIAEVVEWHPEYRTAVDRDLDKDFTPDGGQTNPFLHMGLHLGIRDQVTSNRPTGIRGVFETLAKASGDAHDAEHRMIECLAETLWEAQSQNTAPDEARYLQRLQALTR